MELYEKNGNILYILNVLKKYSDEEHKLSISDIRKKINENEINDIAMAADLDPKIATLVILHEDLLVADFEETGKANGVVTYIEPIAALYSMIVKGTDVFDYLPPFENLFKRIDEIGLEAINIVDAAWRKVVSTSWNDMLKERFYN